MSKEVDLGWYPSFTTNEKESKKYAKQSMEIILEHKNAIKNSINDLLYNISGNDHNKRMLLFLLNIQDTIAKLKEIEKNFKEYLKKTKKEIKMSTDKRSVFTDALETLGTIIDDTQKRDAIHLAVEPVVAKQSLFPGDHVTSDGRKCDAYSNEAVGIVDPFLYTQPYSKTEKESSYYACVLAGQRFWLVLYPRTIKSLRHVWEHPAFPPSELSNVSETSKESEIEKSKKWVEDFVKKCQEIENGIDYEYIKKESLNYKSLMAFADDWVESKEEYPDYFYVSESLRNEGLPDVFWDHYQIITGKKVEERKRKSFFTCAC